MVQEMAARDPSMAAGILTSIPGAEAWQAWQLDPVRHSETSRNSSSCSLDCVDLGDLSSKFLFDLQTN